MTPPELRPETTRAQALQRIAEAFRDTGLDDPRREARLALRAALDVEAGELLAHPETSLGAAAGRVLDIVRRRLAHEPLSRILGRREFFGIDFTLTPEVLDPRPDTETLVEAVLDHAAQRGMAARPLRVIDLGVGSGAILAAVLTHLPQAQGLGTDIADGALACAGDNLRRCLEPGRASLVKSDWWQAIEGAFDIVLSNPPYIASGALAGLDLEVKRYDPAGALDGGGDGLNAYRAIAAGLDRHLAPGGFGAFEVGAGQAPAVSGIFTASGFHILDVRRDLGGIERIIMVDRSA